MANLTVVIPSPLSATLEKGSGNATSIDSILTASSQYFQTDRHHASKSRRLAFRPR